MSDFHRENGCAVNSWHTDTAIAGSLQDHQYNHWDLNAEAFPHHTNHANAFCVNEQYPNVNNNCNLQAGPADDSWRWHNVSQMQQKQREGFVAQQPHSTGFSVPSDGFVSNAAPATAKKKKRSKKSSEPIGVDFIVPENPAMINEMIARAHAKPHLVTFCEVPGRLSLLGSHRKTVVTLAEIKRRINPPESLNQSLMSAMLRKAKNKDGGEQIAKRLRDFGLILPQGRRKPLSNTLFTSLCEGEALQLANDFSKLSQNHFPTKSIVYESLTDVSSTSELSSNRAAYQTTFGVVEDILKILAKDKSPVCDMPFTINSELRPESQKEFTHFSLLTHGFGMPAHIAALSTLTTTLREAHHAMAAPTEFSNSILRPVPTAVSSALLEQFLVCNRSKA